MHLVIYNLLNPPHYLGRSAGSWLSLERSRLHKLSEKLGYAYPAAYQTFFVQQVSNSRCFDSLRVEVKNPLLLVLAKHHYCCSSIHTVKTRNGTGHK